MDNGVNHRVGVRQIPSSTNSKNRLDRVDRVDRLSKIGTSRVQPCTLSLDRLDSVPS